MDSLEDLFYRKLILTAPMEHIRLDEPMEYHTSLHIGGKADYYISPADVEEVRQLFVCASVKKCPIISWETAVTY